MLQLIPIVLVVYSFFLVRTNIATLPLRVPMHFNAAGVVDGWGTPGSLWILVGVQALTCAVLLSIPYLGQLAPGAVHLGRKRLSDFPEEQRPQVLAMLSNMAAYMNIVMNLFLVNMLRQIIQAAGQGNPQIHPIFPLVLTIAGMGGILVYYALRFRSVGKDSGAGVQS